MSIVVGEKWRDTILEVNRISDRITIAKLSIDTININIMSARMLPKWDAQTKKRKSFGKSWRSCRVVFREGQDHKLPQTAQEPTHLINNNSANFFSVPTYPEEMINIVNSAKSKKACGYDNIDPYVVQQVIPQIATQLAHIFNRSFITGIVPNKLKIGKVIPIIIIQKRKS